MTSLRVAVACLLLGLCTAARQRDRVTRLPGLQSQPSFKHYAGYLQANEGRSLFYWFVEAEKNPETAPLVIYLAGGPGCSSVGLMLMENGPWRVGTRGLTLQPFEHSWNKRANILYIDSPYVSGFSYNTTAQNGLGVDVDTDALTYAIDDFFLCFGEFRKNELFISGESYSGIIVPILSDKLSDGKKYNFKGFLVISPTVGFDITFNAMKQFELNHGLMTKPDMSKLMSDCNCTGTLRDCKLNWAEPCGTHLGAIFRRIGLNKYNIKQPCAPNTKATFFHATTVNGTYPVTFIPCYDSRDITGYLRRSDVRKALHVPDAVIDWQICRTQWRYTQPTEPMKSVYERLLQKNLSMALVGNEFDLRSPIIGMHWFLDGLNLMKQWTQSDAQDTKATLYSGPTYRLILQEVKDTGHYLMHDDPVKGFGIFERFLQKEWNRDPC